MIRRDVNYQLRDQLEPNQNLDESDPCLSTLSMPLDEKRKAELWSFVGGSRYRCCELQDSFVAGNGSL